MNINLTANERVCACVHVCVCVRTCLHPNSNVSNRQFEKFTGRDLHVKRDELLIEQNGKCKPTLYSCGGKINLPPRIRSVIKKNSFSFFMARLKLNPAVPRWRCLSLKRVTLPPVQSKSASLRPGKKARTRTTSRQMKMLKHRDASRISRLS